MKGEEIFQPQLSEPSPAINAANSPGKNNAISKNIACCILNRTSLFKPGLDDKVLSAKNAINPENGILLYAANNNPNKPTKGLSAFSIIKNRPNCNDCTLLTYISFSFVHYC